MTNEKQAMGAEEARITPYLGAILYPARERRILPEAEGTYPVRYLPGGHDVTPEDSNVTPCATLNLTEIALPTKFKALKAALKGVPVVAATIRQPKGLTLFVQGTAGQITLPEDIGNFDWLVPQEALASALHKAYGVNLGSLWGLVEVTHFNTWPHFFGDWLTLQKKLCQQAFGHDEFKPSTRSLPNIRDFGQTATYYYLADVCAVLAFLDLVQSRDIPLTLPASDCAIRFNLSGEDRAEVIFFDKGKLEGSEPVILQGRPEYGRATNKTLAEIFRYRHEIRETHEKRRQSVEEVVNLLRPNHEFALEEESEKQRGARQTLSAEEKNTLNLLMETVDERSNAVLARQDDILPLYSELTKWAVQHKERILKTVREKQRIAGEVGEARTALSARAESFVQLPNNMDMLPAHFAAIPKGIVSGLELVNDHFGRAILRVGRTPLDVPGHKARAHTPLTLPLVGLNDTEKSATFEQAKLILGDNGPRWLLPQGLVAVSKLYRAGGGYSKESFVHRLYLNDWIDTMRPAQVERFKAKGRASAFGYERSPKDLYHALLGVLNRLTYERDNGPEWSQLSGFYLIVEHGEDSRGIWTDIMLNPNLHRFVIGAEGLPYMMTNTEAMLSYNKAALDYTPAAQWGLEQLARENLYGRDTATLSDPKGGGFTRLTLAHRFGLIKGPEDSPVHLLRRFNGVLDNLGKAGVIAEVKVDGREKAGADAFGVKLLVTLHDDYRKAYNLTKKENALARLDKQLEAPFAPPKKLSRTPPAPGQPRKRGRPPKKG